MGDVLIMVVLVAAAAMEISHQPQPHHLFLWPLPLAGSMVMVMVAVAWMVWSWEQSSVWHRRIFDFLSGRLLSTRSFFPPKQQNTTPNIIIFSYRQIDTY